MKEDLPQSLREPYYGHGLVDGFTLPDEITPPRNGRLLPIPVSSGWSPLYHCLDWLKQKKNYLPKLVERFSLESVSDGVHYGMRVFLVHYGLNSPDFSDSDILMLHQDTQSILHIPNGDVANMRFLVNYAEAVDRYCAHILLGEEERFDFLPFTGELALK